MDQVRLLAGDLLAKITEQGAFSGQILDEALSSANLDQTDRGFVTELVYGSLTRLSSIDALLNQYSKIKTKKMETKVLTTLRIAIYQIKYLDRVPDHAAVNEAVKILRKQNPRSAGFANGVLRSILREDRPIKFSDRKEEEAFQYSLKRPLLDHFYQSYGSKDAQRILKESLDSGGLTLRINPSKTTAKEYGQALDAAKVNWQRGYFSEDFFHIEKAGAVRDLPGYAQGIFSIQNEAAALPAMVLDRVVSEGTLLDLCAAPGGKSAYLAERSPKERQQIAFDVSSDKVLLMSENFKRLGLNIQVKLGDATRKNPDLVDSAQGILLDVPCSGLGLLARKPDIRLRMNKDTMAELALQGGQMLEVAANYLKDGGILVYSTCTLNPGENELLVERFLSHHPEFELKPKILEDLTSMAESQGFTGARLEDGSLTILPGQGLDGFYLAVLQKKQK